MLALQKKPTKNAVNEMRAERVGFVIVAQIMTKRLRQVSRTSVRKVAPGFFVT